VTTQPVSVQLGPVPETLLWTLWHRAVEARRRDTVLRDPLAVELVGRIDFPFEERFGDGRGLSQWQALRARCFDDTIRRFLAAHADGTVVALGEGLETQFWRVDNGRARWLTVDLPEVVDLRARLLPSTPRMSAAACSALDPHWLDEVDASRGVLLTAQGLLMYLVPDDVHGLIARVAKRFAGGALVFDAVPTWFARRTLVDGAGVSGDYKPPPWLWSLDGGEERRLRALPGVAKLRPLHLPRGRGAVHGYVLPLATMLPPLRRLLLTVLLARFRP